MRSNDDKLTANYVSAMSRAGLQGDLKPKFMEFRLENGVNLMSNDTNIECIRNILITTESAANKLAGANASALISGKQAPANALAAAPAPVINDKPHTAKQPKPKPRGGREQNQQQKPHDSSTRASASTDA